MKGKKIVSTLLALLLLASLPVSALAAEWDISNGDITVNAGSGGQTVTQGSQVDVPDSAPVITGSSTENTVTIHAENGQTASVTLSDASIDVSGKDKAAVSTNGEGNVSIELNGDNTLKSGYKHAGLEKNNGGSLTIADQDKNGKLTATGGQHGAGIGGGNGGTGSDITISGGEITATGGTFGAGIGGGDQGSGSGITISGGEVKATGGLGGAGIGGGCFGDGNNIAVSGAAKLKVQCGIGDSYIGDGAGIGGGGGSDEGLNRIPGAEVEPDICALETSGKIEYYAPGSGMTGDPIKTVTNSTGDHVWDSGVVTKPATCTEKGVKTYTCAKDPSHTKTEDIPSLGHSFDGQEYVSNNDATYENDGTKTAKCVRYDQCGETNTIPDEGTRLERPEQPAPLYRVTDKDGRDIAYTAEQKGGVLTVTVDANFAVLTGSLSGITALRAQGVEKIIFVTNGATSAFMLSDLLGKGEGGEAYWLTHNGKTVKFTLGEKMANVKAILIKP